MSEHAVILPELEANRPPHARQRKSARQPRDGSAEHGSTRSSSTCPGLAGLAALWWLAGQCLQSSPTPFGLCRFRAGPSFDEPLAIAVIGRRTARRRAEPVARFERPRLRPRHRRCRSASLLALVPVLESALQLPFQILRMISPLSWMPIAILAFPTWDGAIVFLIAAAAVWPIVFATAAGVKRIDPAWIVCRPDARRPRNVPSCAASSPGGRS